MRQLFALSLIAAIGLAWGAEPKGVRNPFWPDGYEGLYEVISPEAREHPRNSAMDANAMQKKAQEDRLAAEEARKAAELALEKARSVVAPLPPQAPPISANDEWNRARRLLRIGNPARVKDVSGKIRTSININGKIYVDGDLVHVVADDIRYTWRLVGVEGTKSIKLVRVRAIPVSELKKGTKK